MYYVQFCIILFCCCITYKKKDSTTKEEKKITYKLENLHAMIFTICHKNIAFGVDRDTFESFEFSFTLKKKHCSIRSRKYIRIFFLGFFSLQACTQFSKIGGKNSNLKCSFEWLYQEGASYIIIALLFCFYKGCSMN